MPWGWTFLALLIVTIVLAVLGLTTAVTALKVLFWIFLALLVIDLIVWLAGGGRRPIVT